jgi:hypothetical protein
MSICVARLCAHGPVGGQHQPGGPLGRGVASFADALIAGKSGIRRITSFDATELQIESLVGWAEEFDHRW